MPYRSPQEALMMARSSRRKPGAKPIANWWLPYFVNRLRRACYCKPTDRDLRSGRQIRWQFAQARSANRYPRIPARAPVCRRRRLPCRASVPLRAALNPAASDVLYFGAWRWRRRFPGRSTSTTRQSINIERWEVKGKFILSRESTHKKQSCRVDLGPATRACRSCHTRARWD